MCEEMTGDHQQGTWQRMHSDMAASNTDTRGTFTSESKMLNVPVLLRQAAQKVKLVVAVDQVITKLGNQILRCFAVCINVIPHKNDCRTPVHTAPKFKHEEDRRQGQILMHTYMQRIWPLLGSLSSSCNHILTHTNGHRVPVAARHSSFQGPR